MALVDVIILLMLGLGAVIGFKRGFLRQTVESIGGILVVVFSFIFMGPMASFLMESFPSIDFGGIFNGISSINILVYDVIAFTILTIIFGIIFSIVLSLARVIERILKATVILAIPSKMLGAVMGAVEAYLVIFIILFILTLPIFNIGLINQSKYKDGILQSTPLVSALAKKTINSFSQIYALRDAFTNDTNRLGLDQKVLKILIDNKLISEKTADKLYQEGKIKAR